MMAWSALDAALAERVDPREIDACRNLWLCVLCAGLHDALVAGLPAPGGCPRGPALYRVWIGSRDFGIVCALAGLDPDIVADEIVRLRGAPRAAAGLAARLGQAHALLTSDRPPAEAALAASSARRPRPRRRAVSLVPAPWGRAA